MRAASAVSATPPAAKKPDREGVLAVLQDQPTLDRVQGIIRELQLDDELTLDRPLDAALRRIREGGNPRVLILDLSDSTAPIAELSAARSVGGADLKILALGTVNDVGLFRDLLSAGASDYLVKPVKPRSAGRRSGKALGARPAAARAPGSARSSPLSAAAAASAPRPPPSPAPGCWPRKATSAPPCVDLDLHFGTVALNLDTRSRAAGCARRWSSRRASTACSSTGR